MSVLFRAIALGLVLLVGGCVAAQTLGLWQGPASAAGAKSEGWEYQGRPAQTLVSRHYRIYTTIEDDEILRQMPQIMEGAYSMYRQLTPGVDASRKPLDCFIFRTRGEWDAYTRKHTGSDSKIYLQIRSGGYTVGDEYVSYYIGRNATFSVAAHEGWHQYCGRYMKGRLPPFLEEGLACMFESISFQSELPRWNLSINPQRAQTLRDAFDRKTLWPLDKLVSTHAGDIVGERMERIDAFYAQSWAFARYLWEGENGRYRPALQTWLAETAAGTVWDPTRTHSRAGMPWSRRAVRPMIEHYTSEDFATLEKGFNAFMRKVAYDELGTQWRTTPSQVAATE